MLVHDRLPDGAAAMAQQKANIHYDYEQMAADGRVRIRTNNPEALKAVHDFLRFQISEHQTGDPMTAASQRFAGSGALSKGEDPLGAVVDFPFHDGRTHEG